MEQVELKTNSRDILGKKVKFLRRQGLTPVHLLGHGLKSLSLQCETANLEQSLNSERKVRPVLVREIQRDPLTGKLLHVDFYQVKMEEKVQVEVPIVLVGEAPALKIKGNTLMHELNTLTVECLPGKIPDKLEVDIGSLTEPGRAIRVSDIAVDPDVTVLMDLEQVVVTVSAARHEEKEVVEEVLVTPPEESKEVEESQEE
jgi:large subunit ribosomal protein L25